MDADDERLADALRAVLTPDAVAAISVGLGAMRIRDAGVARQTEWLHDHLVTMVGGPGEVARVADELGL